MARGLPGARHPPPLLLHRLPAEPGAAGAGAGGGAEPDEVEEQENKDEVDGHVTGQEGGERGWKGRGGHRHLRDGMDLDLVADWSGFSQKLVWILDECSIRLVWIWWNLVLGLV